MSGTDPAAPRLTAIWTVNTLLTLAGLALGLCLATAAARLTARLLYGVTPAEE